MKVLLTKKFMPEDIEYIQSRISPKVELIFPEGYDEISLCKQAEDAEVLLGSFFSENLLTKAIKLKFAQIPWTGVDNLDFELLTKHNVVLCNSHSNSEIVAEHAVAMMFDAAKKLSYHDRFLRKGDWNRLFPGRENSVSPFSKKITNSNVGLIGFGAISRHIYRMLSGFNCNFKIFNRTGEVPLNYGVQADAFMVQRFYDNAADLDFIFIAIPLTEETKGMIDHRFFEAASEKAILINISRGQVLNPGDLFNALNNKKIAGAAVDTWYNYPTPSNSTAFPSDVFPFHELDNLVLSPHRAGYVDSGYPHLDDAIENLNRSAEGLPVKNVIILKYKY